jgi:hypothetical protein
LKLSPAAIAGGRGRFQSHSIRSATYSTTIGSVFLLSREGSGEIMEEQSKLYLYEVMEDEFVHFFGEEELSQTYRALRDSLGNTGLSKAALNEKLLPALRREFHRKNLLALCLSGGGIRSATFALGLMQGLARKKRLDLFHYLSTVSGGGYIGSWLSAWIHRNGREEVFRQLENTEKPSPIDVEPEPIGHLRSYSNYLSPKLGFLSADTWTLVSIYFRNLLLNWAVIIPLLLTVLLIPRLGVALVQLHVKGGLNDVLLYGSFITGFLAGVWALTYVAIQRPSFKVYAVKKEDKAKPSADYDSEDQEKQHQFLRYCFFPLLLSCVLLSLFWVWLHNTGPRAELPVSYFLLFGFSINGLAGTLTFLWFFIKAYVKKECSKALLGDLGKAAIPMLVAGIGGGAMLYLIGEKIFRPPYDQSLTSASLYTCFMLPLMLAAFYLATVIFAAFTSKTWRWVERLTNRVSSKKIPQDISDEADREWMARAGAWLLIGLVVWIAISVLVIFAPVGLIALEQKLHGLVTASGALSGFVTWLFGQGSKTGANKEQEQGGWQHYVLKFAAPLFLIIFIASLSLVNNLLLILLRRTFGALQTDYLNVAPLPSEFGDFQYHQFLLSNSSVRIIMVLTALLFLLGIGAGFLINANKFSLHSMYRNRLIRAYLGASNLDRHPNKFTGFDEQDNFDIYKLQSEKFHRGSFQKGGTDFADHLKQVSELSTQERKAEPIAEHKQNAAYANLFRHLSAKSKVRVREHIPGSPLSVEFLDCLIGDLNGLTEREDFATILPEVVKAALPADNKAAQSLLAKASNLMLLQLAIAEDLADVPKPGGAVSAEQMIAEATEDESDDQKLAGKTAAPPKPLVKPPKKFFTRPLHVVNMALNLVGGDNLAWQQRQAESFTVSPLHAGNYCIGYRTSKEYGEAISLGTSVAISGAAVSPNMGYHSSPLVTFILTLFNARLGWWLGNPKNEDTYRRGYPKFAIRPIIEEALGLTNDENPYIYLSDGGHFENLGLYEMILRRCKYIVVSDAGQDSTYAFEDLGNAIRKIRIDLGVEITMSEVQMYPRNSQKKGVYFAIGKIDYSTVDKPQGAGNSHEGVLIYVKPAFYGDEPMDVFNYAQSSLTFPHETTADQFFNESQFESYRSLGLYIADRMYPK